LNPSLPNFSLPLACEFMKRAYSSAISRAIASVDYQKTLLRLCVIALSGLAITACGPKKEISQTVTQGKHVAVASTEKPSTKPIFHASLMINALMQQARMANDPADVLLELERMSQTEPAPVAEEAAFRRAQLQLEFHLPEAIDSSNTLLATYPEHPLIPYLHLWRGQWWYQEKQLQSALTELIDALSLSQGDQQLIAETLSFGVNVTHTAINTAESISFPGASDQPSPSSGQNPASEALHLRVLVIHWLLLAAETNPEQQDIWLRSAADQLNMDALHVLQQKQWLSPSVDNIYAPVIRQFARRLLIAGDKETLQSLYDDLRRSAADAQVTADIKHWMSGKSQPVRIGVLLPLSGHYGSYGGQVLDGVRLFIQQEFQQSDEANITLLVEDTAVSDIRQAYRHLLDQQVDWIIGPLLSDNQNQLAPYLQSDVPVISLNQNTETPKLSPALFSHSLARNIQARFLARYAFQNGMKKMAILRGESSGEIEESDAFAAMFTKLGGEITHVSPMPADNVNALQGLFHFRAETDDEQLLRDLDEDIQLFSPTTELEIRMPVNVDGIYVALSGERVAQLAGQLAYVDIRHVPLLGSNRWADGHIMDDRGRYLSKVRFAQPVTARQQTSQMLNLYRQVWGQSKADTLTYVGYDTARIIFLLGSRLALSGKQAIQSLHDKTGFPGESGHVYFNEDGIGEKYFDLYKVDKGEIEPAT